MEDLKKQISKLLAERGVTHWQLAFDKDAETVKVLTESNILNQIHFLHALIDTLGKAAKDDHAGDDTFVDLIIQKLQKNAEYAASSILITKAAAFERQSRSCH